MTIKNYTIEFYTGSVGADGDAGHVADILEDIYNLDNPPAFVIRGMVYEIRELTQHNRGASFTGVFAKFREDDIPHLGAPGQQEREIDLAEGEGLIEKNYFSFHRDNSLLTYQRNRNGSGTTRFSEYFTDVCGETVVFDPVLQPEPARRLMSGDVIPKGINLSFSKPTNRDFFPRNNWSNRLFELLSEAGGVRMAVNISTDARSADQDRRTLRGRMKQAMRELSDTDGVSVARLMVEEDGVDHPIDLIADRILSKQDVEMRGRYPDPNSMLMALRRAREDERNALNEYFGGQGAVRV